MDYIRNDKLTLIMNYNMKLPKINQSYKLYLFWEWFKNVNV